MNIAFVSDAVLPYNKGGKEKRLFEISRNLVKRGHHVTIYTMKWWTGDDTFKLDHGVRLQAISPFYPLYSNRKRSMKQAVLFSLHCFSLAFTKFDVIDVDHMPHLVLFPIKLICILKRKKMIATWQEVWGLVYWKKYLGALGYIAYCVEYMSARLPDTIISVSGHTKRKLQSELNVKAKIFTVNNSVNFSDLQKVKPSHKQSDIIFAGRLLSHKNIDILIRSIAIIKTGKPNITCLIIGNGPEKYRLQKLVRDFKLTQNVYFLDFMDNQNSLYALMKSSKVFVLPSTREGFGIVVIEANACGIPVITINHKDNAAKELIRDSINGFTSNLDTVELASFIKTVLNQRMDKKAKQKCLDSAKTYNWNTSVTEIEKAYLV
jgi:glycosyltransferase involved in cell wall biosynthesis